MTAFIMEEWRHESLPVPMIEPLLCGIVLGLIPVTLVGLFVAAWNQYRRGSALGG
jgi:cytochrome b6-f complex subunit 5